MFKKTKLNSLLIEHVVNKIWAVIDQDGFKYLKTKKYFVRKTNGFDQRINIQLKSNALSTAVEDENNLLRLNFSISTTLHHSQYEKWYLKNCGERSSLIYSTKNMHGYTFIPISSFEEDDQFQPTPSIRFKGASTTLSLVNRFEEPIHLSQLLNGEVQQMVQELEANCNIGRLHSNHKRPMTLTYLLFYLGETKIAYEQLDKLNDIYVNALRSNAYENKKDLTRDYDSYNSFLLRTTRLTGKVIEKVVFQGVTINESRNTSIEFTENSKFAEIIRVNVEKFEVRKCFANLEGSTLVLFTKKIVILDRLGALLIEHDIVLPLDYYNLTRRCMIGYVEEIGMWFVNHILIGKDLSIVKLDLPKRKLAPNSKHRVGFSDFKYDPILKKILVLWEDKFIQYNLKGTIHKEVELSLICVKILLKKRLLLSVGALCNFKGEIFANLEVAKNNSSIEISRDEEEVIFFGFVTKSHYFKIDKRKHKILWAHPSYIKGYRKSLYDNVPSNLSLNFVKFSPENTCIIGAGKHGKYVAWAYPNLERYELIPSEESLKYLNPERQTVWEDNRKVDKVIRPEIIEVEGVKYLKNRGNNISNIFFLEEGEFFVTEHQTINLLLVWDRKFKNTKYIEVDGTLNVHNMDYITIVNEEELVLFKREHS